MLSYGDTATLKERHTVLCDTKQSHCELNNFDFCQNVKCADFIFWLHLTGLKNSVVISLVCQ